jgi:hypothetical protein
VQYCICVWSFFISALAIGLYVYFGTKLPPNTYNTIQSIRQHFYEIFTMEYLMRTSARVVRAAFGRVSEDGNLEVEIKMSKRRTIQMLKMN